jgi:hypothetical protein
MRAKPGLQKILIVWAAAYVLALNAIIGSFAGAMAYAATAPALGSICHTSEGEPQPSAPQRAVDCSHCVLCQAPSGGAMLPVIAAILEPVATDTRRIILRADAVPQRPFTSAHARAPPLRS